MNYFVLLGIYLFSTVFAQQFDPQSRSDQANKTYAIIQANYTDNEYFPEARQALVEGYLKCVNSIAEAENTVEDAFSTAINIAATQPLAAKELIDTAIESARQLIFLSGIQVFKAQGSALGLSNDGAKEGLLKASQLTQTGGVDSLNGIDLAKNLVSQGSTNKGISAKLAYEAAQRIARTAFTALYDGDQRSFPIGMQALKDAHSNPRSSVKSENAKAAANDEEASAAIEQIKRDVDNAKPLASNSTLIDELRTELINTIGDLAKIAADAKATVENIRNNSTIDFITAKMLFFKSYEQFKADIGNAVGNALITLQSLAARSSRILTTDEIDQALIGVITSRTKLDFAQIAAADLICIGLAHEGETLESAFDAAIDGGKFAKTITYDSVVEAGKRVASLL